MSAVDAALARAHAAAAAPRPVCAEPDGGRRLRTLAIGDPQAPLETFLRILDAHDALDDEGRLRAETALISMGDHFDWGKPEERAQAAADARALLAWLVGHPADQVVVLAGNHDLARVGELHAVDDDGKFHALRARADALYQNKTDKKAPPSAEERAFAAESGFTSPEMVSRDLSTFEVAQRALVEELLRARRMKLAYARGDLLFVHAGVTLREIDAVGLHLETPAAIADALNRALDEAVDAKRRPLAIHGVHTPGDAEREGSGALYHRAAHAITEAQKREGRRYDPRTLPPGVVQVIGHVRDKKSREMLGPWCDDRPAALGVLRHMIVRGDVVTYAHGVPQQIDARAATMLFLDGGMNDMRDRPEQYELFDVERRAVAERRRT